MTISWDELRAKHVFMSFANAFRVTLVFIIRFAIKVVVACTVNKKYLI